MVEVVARFGDDVVDVRHIAAVRPRPVAVLVGIAGVAFVIAAIVFGIGLAQAADNADALAAWTGPKFAFHPERFGIGPGIVAVVALGIGIVVATLATFRWKARGFPGYRIGRDGGVDLAVDEPTSTLVAWTERGFVHRDGSHVSAEPIVTRIGDSIDISVRLVAVPRAIAARASADREMLRCLAISLGLHAVLWGFVEVTPVDTGAIELEYAMEGYSYSGTMQLTGPPNTHNNDDRDRSPDRERAGAGGGAMALESGIAGDTAATQTAGHIRIKRHDETRSISRDHALEQARTAGILGSAAITDPDAFHALVGTGDISSGIDDTNVYGALYGGDGESRGTFGMSISGYGIGCADATCSGGTIGVGRYGTIGNGQVAGDGWGGSGAGAGGGMGGMIGRTSAVPTVVICGTPRCVVGVGGLDKAIIRRYIRRELPKIQYCYEKQLLAKPGLAGDVDVEFLIDPAGAVSAASASGVDDDVSSCVRGVIEGIQFPHNDQNTRVHYPFTFQHAS
jgi:hypothetical protein